MIFMLTLQEVHADSFVLKYDNHEKILRLAL